MNDLMKNVPELGEIQDGNTMEELKNAIKLLKSEGEA